ncbi:MAG: hypothetical protein WBE74_01405 [Terracidiphilus sp.]
MAIGYWLLAIGYWLLAIGYWLLAIGYWLLGSGSRRDPEPKIILLALAAAIGAAVLAAGLAAAALAAVLAVSRLGRGGLCDCGYGKNNCERDQCKCALHLFLLLDGIRHVCDASECVASLRGRFKGA